MQSDEARCIQIIIETGGLNMEIQFDLNAFTWFHPEPQAKWIVSIPNRQCVNINAVLLKEIPHSILLGYNAGEKKLAIRAEEDSSFLVPKRGSIKAAKVITFIVESGVRLPARFVMEKVQDAWIGTLEDQPLPLILQDQPVRERKRRNLTNTVKGADQST